MVCVETLTKTTQLAIYVRYLFRFADDQWQPNALSNRVDSKPPWKIHSPKQNEKEMGKEEKARKKNT